MSNIEELQRRITTAMDRVAQGLDQIGGAAPGPDPEVLQALEDERTANEQLQERVLALRTKSNNQRQALQAELDESEGRMAQVEIEMQRLRRANELLVESCAALREANAEGVGDPHLINKAMLAELEGLRAARATDVAESSAILSALAPLLDKAGAPAPQEEDI